MVHGLTNNGTQANDKVLETVFIVPLSTKYEIFVVAAAPDY